MSNERIQNRLYTTDGKGAGAEEKIGKDGTDVWGRNRLDCLQDGDWTKDKNNFLLIGENRSFGQYLIITPRKEMDLICFGTSTDPFILIRNIVCFSIDDFPLKYPSLREKSVFNLWFVSFSSQLNDVYGKNLSPTYTTITKALGCSDLR
jgi:hypothetical protein